MFNKKPRRNFRQRKNESSDEELGGVDGGKDTEKPDSKADLPRGGISSSSKARECESSDAEEPVQSRDMKHQSKSKTLSFFDDKDGKYFTVTSHTLLYGKQIRFNEET